MIFQKTQAMAFLSDIPPFSLLSEDVLEKMAEKIKLAHCPAGTIILEQGGAKADYLYIILKGAVERYFEKNDKKILSGLLGEKEMYGGISMLVNHGKPVRTLMTREESSFYLLPKDVFLKVCKEQPLFSNHFTNIFGRRMLDRSYSDMITNCREGEDDSPLFFNHSVSDFFTPHVICCDMTVSIQDAAIEMADKNRDSILIKDSRGKFVGIVTDNDLRSRVIAKGYDTCRPIHKIMSPSLHSIPSKALVFEALIKMMRKNIKHLAVTDAENKVCGMVTNQNLLAAQTESPFILMRQIISADDVSQLFDKHARLPRMIQGLIHSGAKAQNINRIITAISDRILKKIIEFAIDELGEPPARFAFMIMGSEGRKEQTLKTDQDNAIVYEDVPKELEKSVGDYFFALGEKVCDWLDQAGYSFCPGEIMAKNPKWTVSLSAWKDYFFGWIHAANPEDLLMSSIFFDFRTGYGDSDLISELREFLFGSLVGWAGFFRNLTENALYFKPPIGFFRNFVLESKGEHQNHFDIKSAMMPIVDFARIHALKNRVGETNTLDRLDRLFEKNALTEIDYNEISKAYRFMMQLRLVKQSQMITKEGKAPNNYINPKKLSRIEQSMLKEIFKRITQCQSSLSMTFMGAS